MRSKTYCFAVRPPGVAIRCEIGLVPGPGVQRRGSGQGLGQHPVHPVADDRSAAPSRWCRRSRRPRRPPTRRRPRGRRARAAPPVAGQHRGLDFPGPPRGGGAGAPTRSRGRSSPYGGTGRPGLLVVASSGSHCEVKCSGMRHPCSRRCRTALGGAKRLVQPLASPRICGREVGLDRVHIGVDAAVGVSTVQSRFQARRPCRARRPRTARATRPAPPPAAFRRPRSARRSSPTGGEDDERVGVGGLLVHHGALGRDLREPAAVLGVGERGEQRRRPRGRRASSSSAASGPPTAGGSAASTSEREDVRHPAGDPQLHGAGRGRGARGRRASRSRGGRATARRSAAGRRAARAGAAGSPARGSARRSPRTLLALAVPPPGRACRSAGVHGSRGAAPAVACRSRRHPFAATGGGVAPRARAGRSTPRPHGRSNRASSTDDGTRKTRPGTAGHGSAAARATRPSWRTTTRRRADARRSTAAAAPRAGAGSPGRSRAGATQRSGGSATRSTTPTGRRRSPRRWAKHRAAPRAGRRARPRRRCRPGARGCRRRRRRRAECAAPRRRAAPACRRPGRGRRSRASSWSGIQSPVNTTVSQATRRAPSGHEVARRSTPSTRSRPTIAHDARARSRPATRSAGRGRAREARRTTPVRGCSVVMSDRRAAGLAQREHRREAHELGADDDRAAADRPVLRGARACCSARW